MNKPIITEVKIKDVKFGKDVEVVSPANIYGCVIGDGCFIGPFTEIQKNVSIGSRTRIQSHTFICELVNVGEDCFIGHGVMFINDLFSNNGPARGNKDLWKVTNIGNNVSIGSNATVLPIDICDNVVIGAGAVVTKNINKPGVYVGNPAKLLKKYDL